MFYWTDALVFKILLVRGSQEAIFCVNTEVNTLSTNLLILGPLQNLDSEFGLDHGLDSGLCTRSFSIYTLNENKANCLSHWSVTYTPLT